jgi:hypothetical protein
MDAKRYISASRNASVYWIDSKSCLEFKDVLSLTRHLANDLVNIIKAFSNSTFGVHVNVDFNVDIQACGYDQG